ncbi:DUF3106 domain-containing protein [Neptuniibacter sp. QD37_11]|uniref:DUF3106 domain-containing protein n=1 Tax=Neptuniibacter sp. QD37_11 TaxID=3398209 RepID=UPI0039F485C6
MKILVKSLMAAAIISAMPMAANAQEQAAPVNPGLGMEMRAEDRKHSITDKQIERWKSMSKEERKEHWQNMPNHKREAMREKWKDYKEQRHQRMEERVPNMTPEQREHFEQKRERFKNATPEQREKMQKHHKHMKNASPEQRENIKERRQSGDNGKHLGQDRGMKKGHNNGKGPQGHSKDPR